VIEALWAIILAAHEALSARVNARRRVKWNAPSFSWQGDNRVTFRLHPGDRVQIVFPRGAGVRADRETFCLPPPWRLRPL